MRHEQALSRDTKQWAARAYDWSKHEENAEDIQDVTDRLAFLLYQTGDVHAAAAQRYVIRSLTSTPSARAGSYR